MIRGPLSFRRRSRQAAIACAVAALLAGCESRPTPTPLPPNAFAFGVFGDAPYSNRDVSKYRSVLGEVNASDISLLLHVGDMLNGPCDDAVIAARATEMRALRPAVVYTPGDNEWTDCHRGSSGKYAPLDRLAFIRRTFFDPPGRTLGATPIPVETQGSDSAFSDAVENVRWHVGNVLFLTLHLVGSGNGTDNFDARTAADDSAAAQRMGAAMAWLASSYRRADSTGAKTIVIAFHANIGFGSRDGIRDGYESFVPRLRTLAAAYTGRTLLIHGDTHDFHYDQALTDSLGAPVPRAWRLETWGSPHVGWVRVVADSVSGEILKVESRPEPVWRVF